MTELLGDGHEVEHALAGVLTGTVATIDDRQTEHPGRQQVVVVMVGGVSDDGHLGTDGVDRAHRVVETLPLGDAGVSRIEVEDLHAQAVLGHLEARHGSGGVLEEHVDGDVPRLDVRGLAGLELTSAIDDLHDIVIGHVLHGQEVASGVVDVELLNDLSTHRDATFRMVTASSPSTSVTRTSTASPREVGMFFPTKSARTGSSR